MAFYSQRTPIFGIPYISDGEILNQQSEQQCATMLENLLFAGINGIAQAIIQEGSYSVQTVSAGNYTVTINASPTYSMLGVVRYMLCKSTSPVVFSGMTDGSFYYLYIQYDDNLRDDASMFSFNVSNVPRTGTDYLLVATLDATTAGNPILDSEPDGKAYTQDFTAHILSSTNPHGATLTQNSLIVSSSLKLKDHFLNETIYLSNIFNGITGQTVATPGKTPVFATVMPTSDSHGDVWCVLLPNAVTVYNSGSTGGGFEIEIKVS